MPRIFQSPLRHVSVTKIEFVNPLFESDGAEYDLKFENAAAAITVSNAVSKNILICRTINICIP